MEQREVVLEVKELTVAFDGRTVVDKISYTLRRGCTLGIVGESGSGKSVSSLALMGLLPRNATVGGSACLKSRIGEYEKGSVNLLSLDEKEFQNIRGCRISMIFQEPMTSLNPVHKCGAQVVEMLKMHEKVSDKEARKRVLHLFEEVLLPRPEKIFDSYPHEISGGQKQRVMIAMALVCNPDILIADEPTTALDVTVQKTILELLCELQRSRGISIIFITHDLGVIAQIADEIAVMYHGEIVEYGDAKCILHQAKHPYTQGLLACRPPIDSRPRRLPTVEDFMGEKGVAKRDILQPAEKVAEREKLLEVRGLNVEFALEKSVFGKAKKKLRAVDGMSFDVYKGETLGLVGESGCGKTTLGRALLRLVDVASGEVSYDGRRLDRMSRSELRRLRWKMQIVFQDPYSSLNPRMTIGQAIMEPLRVCEEGRGLSKSEMRVRVLELMERVGLSSESFDRYPHEFSGGQRQRVCIARALIVNPELVICDESVSALDVSVQAQVLNLLNDLKEHFHYTYIFISHDLSVVHFISDRIMVMREGRLVELDYADNLFNHPSDAYTRKLLDAIPRIE